MTRDLVVAWCNERGIEWVNDQAFVGWRKFVYSKGSKDYPPGVGCRLLPNVGREGHTYLHHLVEQYDDLGDVTIFSQGRYRDQAHQLPSVAHNVGPTHEQKSDFVDIGQRLFEHNIADPKVPWLNATQVEGFKRIFGKDPPNKVVTCHVGAFFLASRERLHRFSREKYVELRDWVYADSFGKDQRNPHAGAAGICMERMWSLMYGEFDYAH